MHIDYYFYSLTSNAKTRQSSKVEDDFLRTWRCLRDILALRSSVFEISLHTRGIQNFQSISYYDRTRRFVKTYSKSSRWRWHLSFGITYHEGRWYTRVYLSIGSSDSTSSRVPRIHPFYITLLLLYRLMVRLREIFRSIFACCRYHYLWPFI